MLASPLSSTFMPDQPMVIIPQHTMPSSAPDSFYYGNGFNLGMHGARTGFSSFGNPNMPAGSVMPGAIGGISPLAPNAFFPSSASSFGSPSVLQSPLSAHAFHPSAFPPSSNDMSVDETTPTSPSSSNSNDLEDEESAAAILHAMESGSLSPRSSPLTQAGMPRSLKHRRSGVSPLGRRKRVSSLSETSPMQGLQQGKEGAEDYFDYDTSAEFGAVDIAYNGGGNSAQTSPVWPRAHGGHAAATDGASPQGFVPLGSSHSLPSASAFSFSANGPKPAYSAFSTVTGAPPAGFAHGRHNGAGFGAVNTNPIPIPSRHHEGFSPSSYAQPNAFTSSQPNAAASYGFGSPIKPHAQKYGFSSPNPLLPSHSNPQLQMHHHTHNLSAVPPVMGLGHHHGSASALPTHHATHHHHHSSSLMHSHGSAHSSLNGSTSSMSSPHSAYGSSPSSSHASHKKKSRNARSRLDNHQCPNCHTSDSPLWRNCQIKGKIQHLCNSCGLRYKKHKYCPHCYKVYYDAETNSHEWTQCGQCHNWTHKNCLSAANIDVGAPGTYKCVRCLGQSPESA